MSKQNQFNHTECKKGISFLPIAIIFYISRLPLKIQRIQKVIFLYYRLVVVYKATWCTFNSNLNKHKKNHIKKIPYISENGTF